MDEVKAKIPAKRQALSFSSRTGRRRRAAVNAFNCFSRFRSDAAFNDDIQGTRAVLFSDFLNAAHLTSAVSGRSLTDYHILFLGVGSAGVGVAMQLMSFFKLQGLSEDESRERIWLADSQELVYDARWRLPEHKKFFLRKDYAVPPITELTEVIEYVKPTALLGLSTIGGIFTQQVIELMAALNPRPIIFPLSNPVRLSECTFEAALAHSNNTAIFASGSPFDPIAAGARTHFAGQGNNMYVFPGLGLGVLLARQVSDTMVEAAALGLADVLTPDERAAGLVYPRLERIREVSARTSTRRRGCVRWTTARCRRMCSGRYGARCKARFFFLWVCERLDG